MRFWDCVTKLPEIGAIRGNRSQHREHRLEAVPDDVGEIRRARLCLRWQLPESIKDKDLTAVLVLAPFIKRNIFIANCVTISYRHVRCMPNVLDKLYIHNIQSINSSTVSNHSRSSEEMSENT